ncbi:MAG TPA: glycoside hydrolase family 88 protein [Vicinamibacterales bacterium]|jgi:rhamnogalacturonyl hydrolase YesR|nr:glycoside hydrolase family 88 protein [Vicinamibacterales bacterium]
MLQLCALAAALAAALVAGPSIATDVSGVAALRGEPRSVSAAGTTRADTPLLTIENPSAFDPDVARLRVVFVGGLDGDVESARAVLAAVRWFKITAPPAIRARWNVSALPLADPDHRANGHPFVFPPDSGFFNDADQPESRYVWRWIAYQAPDLVIDVRADTTSPDSLATALSDPQASGLGAVPVDVMRASDVMRAVPKILAAAHNRSALRDAINSRVTRGPLATARILARRYPQMPSMSYIPTVAWINTLRLAMITGDDAWRVKVRDQTHPWIAGGTVAADDRKQLTSLAGYAIFGEIAVTDGNATARALLHESAAIVAARKPDGVYEAGRGWTDDMFMATAVLARTGDGRLLDLAARQLIDYAGRLQRPDGVFMHAVDGPVAWGRGNGFAALGLMEALSAIPQPHPSRARLLEIYRRQMAAMKANQAPDGTWREIIDQPGAYREETATAMLLTAMARGVRLGWIDTSYRPIIVRAWRALSAHVADDGALVDVCTGTGAGPTPRYYLDRAAIDGADDRGGAMALLASIEMYEATKGRRE